MKNETKLYIGIGVFGALMLATGNSLMMGAGALCLLLYPMSKFNEFTNTLDGEE